jgi:fatty acid desaturase
MSAHSTEYRGREINWHRVPIDKETLRELTRRSDLKGLAQAGGHLLLVAATGLFVFWSYGRLPWYAVIAAFFVHGTVMQFMGGAGAFHELCHGTPFKSRWLNETFLWIYSFFSWCNFVWFRTSHMRHHQYTTHRELDLEVVLPGRVRLRDFLWQLAFHPVGVYGQLRTHVRLSLGILEGEWEKRIFSDDGEKYRSPLFTWARFLVLGHIVLGVLFALLGAWILIPIFLTPFYASWLTFLCGVPQHFGLLSDSPDWRRSCRTVLQDPITRFLYWQMNYHTEHHMYAAVPFHALPRLHRVIAADSPKPNRGLVSAWKEIIQIARRLREDPGYVFDSSSRV